jgi:hypothetical protein
MKQPLNTCEEGMKQIKPRASAQARKQNPERDWAEAHDVLVESPVAVQDEFATEPNENDEMRRIVARRRLEKYLEARQLEDFLRDVFAEDGA